ncbi:MAG: hypothetical protein HZA95_02810 [Candidatus Vogelbacteria bacterium]|nr:hypothetical protein [Candidatus Vogelbacteria bacterium]
MSRLTKIKEIKPRRIPRGTVEKVVLGTVAVAGVLAVTALAPAIFVALRKLGFLPRSSKSPFYINSILGKLRDEGLVEFVKDGRISKLRLTESGENKLRHYRVTESLIDHSGKWDGKWRMIIFDIKETRRMVRDTLRDQLIFQGFRKLQHSVWVYPYDCEEFIGLLKTAFSLGKSVIYIIAERVENDSSLREYYGLTN